MKKIQLIYGMIFLFVLGTAQNEENQIIILESEVGKVHILPDSVIHPEYSLEENLRAYYQKDTVSKADTTYGFGENSIFLHQKIQSEFLYFDPLVGKNISGIKPDVVRNSKYLRKISWLNMLLYTVLLFFIMLHADLFVRDGSPRSRQTLFLSFSWAFVLTSIVYQVLFPDGVYMYMSLLFFSVIFFLSIVISVLSFSSKFWLRFWLIVWSLWVWLGIWFWFKIPIFFVCSIIGFALALLVLGIEKYIKNKKLEDFPLIEKNADQGPGFGY